MTVIDDSLAKVPAPEKAALEHIRQLVHDTVPDVQEVLTYGMAGFKYKDKYLFSFGAFKDHLSLFPGALPEDIVDQLDDFTLSKGTIQFSLDHQVPEPIIRELLTRRMAAIDAGKSYQN